MKKIIERPVFTVFIGFCIVLTLGLIFLTILKSLAIAFILAVVMVVIVIAILATSASRINLYVDDDILASRILETEPPGTASATFPVSILVGLIIGLAALLVAGIISAFEPTSMVTAGIATFTVATPGFFFCFN
jgi:hypothetical protein